MILLTGATGLIGSRLVARLTARGTPVRCLVRDPRRLGPQRVRVQITLGDLADPAWLRQGLRGVKTVVHLGATRRDQPHATIEEVDALGTWRLLRAAEAAGVEHVVFLTPLGATPWHRSRVQRAKALAEQAVAAADLRTTILRCSLVYAPGEDPLSRLARLPAVPLAGLGRGTVQPIHADDVAHAIAGAVDRPAADAPRHAVADLAGPETLTHRELAERLLRGRGGRIVPVPLWALRPGLRGLEALTGAAAVVTWDEAGFRATTMTTPHGTRDAEALGVRPRPLTAALGG